MMREPSMYSWSNPWFRWSTVWLVVLIVLSLLVGFVVLPAVHGDFRGQGIWSAICRAAGMPASWIDPRSATPAAGPSSTAVVFSPAMGRRGTSDAIGRGATLAVQQCSMCHGAQGMSGANAPNLAGQYPEVVIKQLQDYARGDRTSSIMQALAANLSERDVADLAAYYDSLPKARTAPARYDETSAPALVRVGDPMRNIAPCIACHGGTDHKVGTPWLEGMPKEYLLAQLRDFNTGARHNDSHAQMRNMARQMSAKEMEEVADFYALREKPGEHR
jgi:cytochrome c553